MKCGTFRTGEDYRDHLPCEVCEPTKTKEQIEKDDVAWCRDFMGACQNLADDGHPSLDSILYPVLREKIQRIRNEK